MANDLVFNMIANSSQFAAGMKQAQKAADALFLATATGAEKFAVELDNLQRISNLTNLDPKVFNRAYQTLIEKHDPFGSMESARIAKDAAAEEKRIATEKANYIAQVVERSNQMQWDSNQNLHRASMNQAAAAQATARQRTASIIASERLAAQASINYINQVAQFRERTSERVGRALIREAQQEARIASIAQVGGIGGNRAMIIQQLAFAAEDAATQFGTRGFAGALMAAGNNLTFAASMMGPTTGILASLGLTGVMVAATMLRIGQAAKEEADAVKLAAESHSKYKQAIEERVSFERQLSSIKDESGFAGMRQNAEDELESNSRLMQKTLDQIAVLKNKQEAAKEALAEKGSAFQGRADWYQWFTGGALGRVEKPIEDLQKEISATADQISKVQSEFDVIVKRRDEIMAAGEKAMQFNRERDARSAKAEEWLDESERISDAEDKMTLRQEMIESRRKRLTEEKRTNNSRLLSGAMDIRSVEAFGVMANAQAQSMLPGMGGASQQTPKATDVDREILKNAAKGAAVLEKLLHEFGRKPSIPIVGLN